MIEISDQIQIRFIASDSGDGSIVEALVDDFTIVNLASSVGISDVLSTPQIQVYPNPVKDEIYFRFDTNQTSKVSIEIFSTTGQLIDKINRSISNSDSTIEWKRNPAIPNGIYFLRISSQHSTITKKMIFRE